MKRNCGNVLALAAGIALALAIFIEPSVAAAIGAVPLIMGKTWEAMTPDEKQVFNLQMRAMLLATSPRMRKELPAQAAVLSANLPSAAPTRIKLQNVGIVTRLLLLVEFQVDIGTAVGTLSARAPYNLISRIRLTDFDGTERVNCTGFQLFMWNSLRDRAPYGINNEGLTATTTLPNTPTAVANNQAGQFLLEIPLAYDPERDLRGAVLAQSGVGEWFLTIDWNTAPYGNGLIDSVWNGAATTTIAFDSLTATVYQEYLLPQNVAQGRMPLPPLDLMTVYEFAGNLVMTDNLAVGTERLLSYPNVRSVIGAYVNYINNNAMADTDMSRMRLIANGNNVLREYRLYDKAHEQRRYVNGDLKEGAWFEMHREKPIETALFGNVQLGFTPAAFTANSSTRLEVGWESFFAKGLTLPGMQQSAG